MKILSYQKKLHISCCMVKMALCQSNLGIAGKVEVTHLNSAFMSSIIQLQ